MVARVLHPETAKIAEVDLDLEPGKVDDDDAIKRDAEKLYKTLASWQDAAGLHERVQAGNYIYRHAAQVRFFFFDPSLPASFCYRLRIRAS